MDNELFSTLQQRLSKSSNINLKVFLSEKALKRNFEERSKKMDVTDTWQASKCIIIVGGTRIMFRMVEDVASDPFLGAIKQYSINMETR